MRFRFRREPLIAAVALIIGLTAAAALYIVQEASTQLVPALVAARDLPARHLIRREDLHFTYVLPAARDPRAVHDPEQLVGHLLLSPVFAGEQFRPGRIHPDEGDLTADEVAVAVETDLVNSVGGLLTAGAVVDIYWIPGSDARALGAPVPRRIAEAVRVLSVRDSAARATGPNTTADPTRTQPAAGLPAVVVLKVPADDRDIPGKLLTATALGRLTFVKWAPNAQVPDEPVFYPLGIEAMLANGSTIPTKLPPVSDTSDHSGAQVIP